MQLAPALIRLKEGASAAAVFVPLMGIVEYATPAFIERPKKAMEFEL
jgi:hypothetical protein